MSKTLDISKISLVTGQVAIDYLEFIAVGEDEVFPFEHSIKGKAPVHADFRKAFKAMEQWVYPTVRFDTDEVKSLVVTQVILKPQDDGVGITMACTFQFKNVLRPLTLNTPFWSTTDSEKPLPAKAVEDIETLKKEAVAYLGGKFDSVQLKFDPEKTSKRLQDETAKKIHGGSAGGGGIDPEKKYSKFQKMSVV